MRILRLSVVLVCGCLWALAPVTVQRELGVRVRMRDGVELSANIFRPAGRGRFPTILVRTPYNKGTSLTPSFRAFVMHGYAVVVQDVRGRYESGGVFDPLRQETVDGEDTLNWIARQGWSNQRIGMLGGSYLGIAQWRVAVTGNRFLKAIFPVVSGCDDYLDRFYSAGGALKLGQRLEWMAENVRTPGMLRPDFASFVFHLPLRTADRVATGHKVDFYQETLDHPSYDSLWKSLSMREKLDRVRVPVFSAGGWYDNFVESDLEAFHRMRELGRPHRILIGPWPHNFSRRFDGISFGPDARVPLLALQLEWFDYWLKGEPERNGRPAVLNPPARIFVMGANRWRDEEEWPLRRALPTPFYLSSRGHANTLAGDGRLRSGPPRRDPPDHFVYDPANPVPTTGGAVCCNPRVFPWGPVDQREIEKRPDVLVYSTEPLKRAIEVTGPVRAVLYVSTSQPDTDFTAKLADVFSDGRAINLCDGILRLRYRESLARPVPAQPGEIYAITIEAGVTSNLFEKGHRIRLEISSSNFPRFDRNPNTGRPVASETVLRRASQAVYHDRRHSSHLLLPVIPDQASLDFPNLR